MVPQNTSYDSLDRSSGTGSRSYREDWLDANTDSAENKWSDSRTTFYTSKDCSGNILPKEKREKYEQLKKINGGWGSYNRNNSRRWTNIVNDIETIASILSLADHYMNEVKDIFDTIDISPSIFGGKPYEKIILAVYTLVIDRDIEDQEEIDRRLIFRDEFRELMEANNLGSSELRRIRQIIRDKTEYF